MKPHHEPDHAYVSLVVGQYEQHLRVSGQNYDLRYDRSAFQYEAKKWAKALWRIGIKYDHIEEVFDLFREEYTGKQLTYKANFIDCAMRTKRRYASEYASDEPEEKPIEKTPLSDFWPELGSYWKLYVKQHQLPILDWSEDEAFEEMDRAAFFYELRGKMRPDILEALDEWLSMRGIAVNPDDKDMIEMADKSLALLKSEQDKARRDIEKKRHRERLRAENKAATSFEQP